jgi:hypothetical protein
VSFFSGFLPLSDPFCDLLLVVVVGVGDEECSEFPEIEESELLILPSDALLNTACHF